MKTTNSTRPTLPQQYILNAMEELEMSGDTYVSDEQLYQRCCQGHRKLSVSDFRQDKAVLLKKGSAPSGGSPALPGADLEI